MHPTLLSQVEDILAETGLSPRQLKLEVTENTVMEYSEKAQDVLNTLDRLGIHLSTDDFGTGYSSLSYLQTFPFDRLKIDRSFVDKLGTNKKSDAIVKTILMLGTNLGMEVVAEGIETIGQLELLQELGCRLGQGFYFSRPVDAPEAEKLISRHPAEHQYLSRVDELVELSGVQ
jgi:EAL domain-containing protein (putative c-di-GMP-specific phosphodiesterase class I)